MRALWDAQRHEWPMMAKGVDCLAKSQVREVAFDGLRCRLQWNPGRAVSASAKVDARSIAARPCFLCEKNRPAEQRGVDAGDGYVFLCNPMPIFDPHFTVPMLDHRPQRIRACLGKMLELAERLSGRFTVFYNGPRCGASAPDHLHLQASPLGVTPFEELLIADAAGFIDWSVTGDVSVGLTAEPVPPAVVILGGDRSAVQARVEKVIAKLAEHFPADPEPMLNALALHTDGTLRVVLFPRAAHRPASFGTDDGQVLVSPGLVDMLGLLITPRREDFDNLDGGSVAKIYREVSRGRGEIAIALGSYTDPG
jgi:Domain of unknown function (DUF4922)